MKKLHRKFLIVAFKFISVSFLASLLCIVTAAWKTNRFADDLWKQLGITSTDGNAFIYHSVRNGNIGYYVKNAKNIAQNDRVEIINDLIAHAKKYVASEEYKRRYENEKKLRKPAEPQLLPINVEEIKASEKAIIEQQIKQTEANANHPNPKIKNGVPAALENLKKELKALDDPNNKRIQNRIKQDQAMNDAIMAKYKKDLQE